MIAYLDSSVLLRIILGQAHRLKEWKTVRQGVTSALTEVECLRTLDRLRIGEELKHEAFARRREAVFRLIEELEVVEMSRPVLVRAALPLPVPLGTLDSIHLATALLWRERAAADVLFATHDSALATEATSCGFRVSGT